MSERQTPEEKREAAAIRRRWITLGEILAVIAVLISGLTLWNSYSERSADAAERVAEKKAQEKVSRTLLLKAEGSGRQLRLAPHDPAQAIQSQTISFPASLGLGPIETLVEPRLEAAWVKAALRKAPDRAKGKASGDARLPVLIRTVFISGGESVTDSAIYDIGYRREDGGLLSGSEIELRGLSLVERATAKDAAARLDAIWKARLPKA